MKNTYGTTDYSTFNGNESNILILDLKKFNNQDKFIKSKIILESIKKVLGSTQGIEKKHVDDITTLCERNIGNKYLTPKKNIKVLVKKGRIYFIEIRNL